FLYKASIEGVADPKLFKLLKSYADTVTHRANPPQSLFQLQAVANKDKLRLIKALRSEGFYSASIEVHLRPEAELISVVFAVSLGPPYHLRSFTIKASDEESESTSALPAPADLGISLETQFTSKQVFDAETRIVRWLNIKGFAFARVNNRNVIVDHTDFSVAVTVEVAPGPRACFGDVKITGPEAVSHQFLFAKLPWQKGDPFDPRLLEKAQKRIYATGLFVNIQIHHADALDESGLLPVTIILKERAHRTIKGGVTYETDAGPGAKLTWEHRNLFHKGESFNAEIAASDLSLAAESRFRKPDFFLTNQSLIMSLRLAEDRPDAFTSRNISASLSVERTISTRLKLEGGISLKASRTHQLRDDDWFGLISFPLQCDWDTSDDILDPFTGGRLSFGIAPFYDAFGNDTNFLKAHIRYNHYLPVTRKPALVLALRGVFGTIAGASRDEIPADERLYSGGGGSVRGYEYKTLSPLRNDEPVGGRSLFECSLEFRLKALHSLGMIAFLDGGTAFESVLPDFSAESLRWGTGFGLRYYTAAGPLRFDIGFPLNRRDHIDDHYQLYVSLGQAF
ncbi:MAG: outer membrane protein assembly factor, partial [Deltaproteobacteria bacterium]|nr:outer membrane protein assembly factor [Deltaproteobacteria bacterium]